ncbi:MAG: hypothetical protein AMXMBFR25_19140 [Lysobacterales bacterium]
MPSLLVRDRPAAGSHPRARPRGHKGPQNAQRCKSESLAFKLPKRPRVRQRDECVPHSVKQVAHKDSGDQCRDSGFLVAAERSGGT